MLRALRAAFLALRGGERNPALGFDVLPGLLATNAAVAAAALGEPLLGRLVPGAPADLAVVDAPPPTPLSRENLFGHLVYGASEAVVRHTVAHGRVLMEDFALTTLDPTELARRAREIAPAAWRRFAALDLTPLENASKWTTNRSSDARAR
jgi:cytosine/adenosine deaminase-related metal-dependent hydrolase